MDEVIVGAIAIIPLVMGLVEYAKRFGLKGQACNALAGALGFLFVALAAAIEQKMIPAEVVPWVNLIVRGLGGTLAAVGLYDLGKRFSNTTR